METKEYRTIDKSEWGDGPWQAEPDKKQWRDEKTGFPCLIVRAPVTGGLCGYVGVSKPHPMFGVAYDGYHPYAMKLRSRLMRIASRIRTQNPDIDFMKCMGLAERHVRSKHKWKYRKPMNKQLDAIEVHGGLTFSNLCTASDDESKYICHVDPGGPPVWWFGFDCGHCYDYSPKMRVMLKFVNPDLHVDEVYRDFAYVTEEVESLSRQLKEAAEDSEKGKP